MRKIIYILLSLILLVGGESFAAKGKGKKRSKKKYSKTAVHKKKTTYKKKAVKAKSPGKFVADTTKMRKIVQATPAIEAFESNPYGDSDDNFAHENDVYTEDPNFDATGLQDSINVNPYKIHFSQLEDSVTFTLIDNFECDYHHPFKGNVTSNFGPRWKRYHMGTDIDLETGDTVYCAFEGTVRIARRSSSFGNVVMVRHKNGLETIYAHLSALNVRNGDHVEAGTIIGLGGNTGHSFGSHLHFEVRYKGYPVDPNKLIAFDEFRPKCEKITLYKEDFNVYAQAKANATKHKSQLKYYKVRKGDTLYSIARKLGTTTKVLQRLNHLGRSSSIKKGRVLKYV
jgi:murein DD-endopeptidase MepM/ murein hydrolase activator NlpD